MIDDYKFLQVSFIISIVVKAWDKDLFKMRYSLVPGLVTGSYCGQKILLCIYELCGTLYDYILELHLWLYIACVD